MALGPIPFGPSQKQAEELAGAPPYNFNVVVDKVGAIRRRPGLRTYSEATASVVDANGIALLHAAENGSLYAVGNHPTNKSIYRVTAGGSLDLTTTTGYKLQGTNRPTVAETEAMLVFAAGDYPAKLEFSTSQTSALGGSPPQATHVIANASRLLLNNVANFLGRISYSAQAAGSSITGHETWSGIDAGFFTAEARPDPVKALHENTNEVFGFGRTSLQYFTPDGTTVYAAVTTKESGIAAPYSVVKVDQNFAWLDHQRRLVMSDGRSLQVLSDDIHKDLLGMTTVEDCYGYRVLTGTSESLVWKFPSDGRSYAFQVGAGWSQWAGYDYSNANWTPMTITSHFLRPGSTTNIVGTSNGTIRELSDAVTSDDGTVIVARSRSGFQNRGTSARKNCIRVMVTLRRGEAATSPGPYGFLRWRDDLGPWSTNLPVGFGSIGDSTTVLEFRSLGVYRTRQWEFEFSGDVDFSLVSVLEEYEVLPV